MFPQNELIRCTNDNCQFCVSVYIHVEKMCRKSPVDNIADKKRNVEFAVRLQLLKLLESCWRASGSKAAGLPGQSGQNSTIHVLARATPRSRRSGNGAIIDHPPAFNPRAAWEGEIISRHVRSCTVSFCDTLLCLTAANAIAIAL